jgi:hypothetical protein
MITKEYLLECFEIEPCGSLLRWKKERPQEHFSMKRTFDQFMRENAGNLAGTKNFAGNPVIKIKGKTYLQKEIIKIMLSEEYNSIEIFKNDKNNKEVFDNKLASAWIAQRLYWRPVRLITWKKMKTVDFRDYEKQKILLHKKAQKS